MWTSFTSSRASSATALCALLLAQSAQAQFYNIDTDDAIRESAKTLAHDLMLYYDGNQTGKIPGILPGPPDDGVGDYYWWEGGAMMGTYVDYWHLTGDSTYNKIVMQGMLHQVGTNEDYQPDNHTASLGNDDQGFWGMTAMLAAENKFPNPPEDKPQWLALAQAVWNTQADPDRHDDNCNGGMRWQIPPTNNGYNYKNTIANGIFFNMGARLARYTNNATYAKHAEDTWDWIWGVNYINHDDWSVYDGGTIEYNCTDLHKATFSYNYAVLLQGCAFMYNFTEEEKWEERTHNLLDAGIRKFFNKGAHFEVPCEGGKHCTTDMLSFKGYVARWMSVVSQIVPSTREKILPTLRKSAEKAVAQCVGGVTGRQCGFYWASGEFRDPAADKTTGAGEAMNVLAAVSSLLIEAADPPATNTTGGISRGNPNAGSRSKHYGEPTPITTGDRAGAGILTVLLAGGGMTLFAWMSLFD